MKEGLVDTRTRRTVLVVAHSFTNLLVHVVFGTKGREPWITPGPESDLHGILGSAVTEEGGTPLLINGVEDHVHLLVKLRPDQALSDLPRAMKARSSGWVRRSRLDIPAFAWQTGYGAFTVSASQTEKVQSYILNQKEHHKRVSFADEMLQFFTVNDLRPPDTFFD
jgi:REP element-mobilizing transposase RayT